jgi:predicted secreted protein
MRLSALALCAVVLLTLTSVARAADDTDKEDRGKTVLQLSAAAERVVPRDRLRATLRAEVTDADPLKVQAEINKRMNKALDRARAASGVKAETGGYSIYSFVDQNKNTLWRGSQFVSITGTDFNSVLNVARDLQTGGLLMSGMGFDLTPEAYQKLKDELEAEAVTKAVARARALAKAAESSVIRVRVIRVGEPSGYHPPMPMPKMMEARMAAAPMQAPAAEAGEETVRVQVEAEVVIAPVK